MSCLPEAAASVAPLVGARLLLHAGHYVIVLGGLAGVVAMTYPQLLHRHSPRPPRTEHEANVARLRRAAEAGTLAGPAAATRKPADGIGQPPEPSPAVAEPPRRTGSPVGSDTSALPYAVVASAAAAGVHAAVGPAHLEEGLLIGSFFVLSSMAQLGWALLVLRSTTRRLLQVGVLLNAGCLVLWAVTRTWGLPFGLIDGPEAVGSWDLAAAAWEVVVVAACLAQLRSGRETRRVGPWTRWPVPAKAFGVGSALALGLLSVTGSGS